MRAAYYDEPGAARDVLRTGMVPDPEPAPGEVRVRVHASGVNPSDVKMRLGTAASSMAFPRIIPHSDGSGIIDRVGDGIPAARLGERVWLWNARWNRAFGTAAEFVTLPAAQAVPLPDGTGFAEGACLGIPALTAWQAVETDGGVDAGAWVLVNGGAGAVGHYAVQMARMRGARVIATVSSPAKAEAARRAGAEIVIDRHREDVVAAVKRASATGVARVIEVDLAGNIAWLPQVVADYGIIVTYGSSQREVPVSFGASILGNIGYRFFIVYNQPPDLRRRALADVSAMLAGGSLIHSIGAEFPLEDIAAAHEAVEKGSVTGNVVVRP